MLMPNFSYSKKALLAAAERANNYPKNKGSYYFEDCVGIDDISSKYAYERLVQNTDTECKSLGWPFIVALVVDEHHKKLENSNDLLNMFWNWCTFLNLKMNEYVDRLDLCPDQIGDMLIKKANQIKNEDGEKWQLKN